MSNNTIEQLKKQIKLEKIKIFKRLLELNAEKQKLTRYF